MKLKEWKQYKSECAKYGVKTKSYVRQQVIFRLIGLYGFDAVISHIDLIKRILDK